MIKEISCPNCFAVLRVPRVDLAENGTCPSCKQFIDIKAILGDPSLPSAQLQLGNRAPFSSPSSYQPPPIADSRVFSPPPPPPPPRVDLNGLEPMQARPPQALITPSYPPPPLQPETRDLPQGYPPLSPESPQEFSSRIAPDPVPYDPPIQTQEVHSLVAHSEPRLAEPLNGLSSPNEVRAQSFESPDPRLLARNEIVTDYLHQPQSNEPERVYSPQPSVTERVEERSSPIDASSEPSSPSPYANSGAFSQPDPQLSSFSQPQETSVNPPLSTLEPPGKDQGEEVLPTYEEYASAEKMKESAEEPVVAKNIPSESHPIEPKLDKSGRPPLKDLLKRKRKTASPKKDKAIVSPLSTQEGESSLPANSKDKKKKIKKEKVPKSKEGMLGNFKSLLPRSLLILLPFLFAFGAFLFYKELKKGGRFLNQEAESKELVAVEIIPCEMVEYNPTITTKGYIRPAYQTDLYSEVSGKITKVSPLFEVGKLVDKNEVLLEIESTAYEENLAKAIAKLSEAYLELQKRESIISESKKGNKRPSEFDLPEYNLAEAQYEKALAGVKRSQLDLENCKIKSPYFASIMSRKINIGQIVKPDKPIGEIYTQKEWKVACQVSEQEAAFLQLDDESTVISGIPLNPDMVLLKVEAMNRISTETKNGIEIYLTPQQQDALPDVGIGKSVELALKSEAIRSSVKVPSLSLYENNLLGVNAENRITFTPVTVLYEKNEVAYVEVQEGYPLPDNVIASALEHPVENMRVILMN